MAEPKTRSTNEIRQFYQLVADEYHGLRDARGQAPMDYQELWCPNCGKTTSHRLEFGKHLEKRHCTECGISREYRM